MKCVVPNLTLHTPLSYICAPHSDPEALIVVSETFISPSLLNQRQLIPISLMASLPKVGNGTQYLPIFNGENYGHWEIKMGTLFRSQKLLDIVEKGLNFYVVAPALLSLSYQRA